MISTDRRGRSDTRAARRLTRARSLDALSDLERERYQTSLAVAAEMRAKPSLSLRRAARVHGIDPRTVRGYLGDALSRERGRWEITPADRLVRPMFIYSGGRRVDLDVRGSRAAATVGDYFNAVQQFLTTGDTTALRRFSGVRIGGVELEADPDVLEELARRRAFDFDSIYRLTT